MAKLFVLLLNQRGDKKVTAGDIETKLDAVVIDWLRVAPNQYFLRFDGASKTIYNAIKPMLQTDDYVIVSELVHQSQCGWVSQLAVDWFAKFNVN